MCSRIQQIWDSVGSLSTRWACTAPGWPRKLSSLAAPPSFSLLHRAGRKNVTMRNFSPWLGTLTAISQHLSPHCRTMAHGVRTSRNTLWHLSLPTECLCTASQLAVGPLWGSRSWSILSLALFFLHVLQGIQSVSLEASLCVSVYLGRDVKHLGARSGDRATGAQESMGTQSPWWVSQEGCRLGMAVCPGGAVRMC